MKTRISRLLLLSALALAACGEPSTIAPARKQALGSTVTVEGVVTVPSGFFQPNDDGFALQDSGAGIYIQHSPDGAHALGERVKVTGTLGEDEGKVLGIAPTSIQVVDHAKAQPGAKVVTTGKVNEDTEGLLIQLTGTIQDDVFDDSPYGWKFNLDDGSGAVVIYVYTGTHLDTSGFKKNQRFQITGFSGQFGDHYELRARYQTDFVAK